MVDLAVLKDLFCDDILGSITRSPVNNRRFTRLKENGEEAKLRKIDLMDIPDDSIVLKMDNYRQPSSLFRGQKGENKRCDYIVITNLDNRDIILFIELKSTSLNHTEIERQFMGAECAIDYCNAALKRFHRQIGYFDSFEKRFVVFYKSGSIQKRTSRPQAINNTIPSRYLKYSHPREPSIRELVRK